MNYYFIAGAVLTFAIGLIHSVVGERLIFRRMRSSGCIPTDGGQLLLERHVRILWASWHVVTAMGWCIAVVLFWLALPPAWSVDQTFVAKAVIVSMFASSILVLVGTKGKHPGWAGLLVVAILTAMGLYA
jgi:hypothetical protein